MEIICARQDNQPCGCLSSSSKEHPVPASIFFQDFSAFLETTLLCPEVLLVSGDFNFHLDDPSDADARKVMKLMDTSDFLQYITTSMHVSGLILNLITSWSLNDIHIFPPKLTHYIYNHCFAECQLSLPGPNILVKEVSYWKFKQIDMDNFRSDIASSVLCNSQWTSLKELAQCYDITTLFQILDKHAPCEYQDSDFKTKSAVVQFGS